MFTKFKHVKAEYNQLLSNFSWVCMNSLQQDRLNSELSIPIPNINLLKMKHNLLCIRNQSVPRCKHFPQR